LPAAAVVRQGQRAGVVSRTLAMVIDICYVIAITVVLYLGYAGIRALRAPARFTWPRATFPTFLIAAAVVAMLMLTASWASLGRTVGMRVMGLRLQTLRGGRMHLGRSFLRAVACLVFPLGLYWSAVSGRNASVQDLVFRTSVIYEWESRVPDARVD
jgi:uncharacterized RDD family membrane protein YckC